MNIYELSVICGTSDHEQFLHPWFETIKHNTVGCIQTEVQTLKLERWN